MKFNIKKIGIFIIFLIFFSIIIFSLINYILPIKVNILNGDIGKYKDGDTVFYTASETYNINDIILYTPTSISSTLLVEIIEINTDGTFKVIGSESEPIDYLNQNNLRQEQIIGKVIGSISSLIFYPLIIIIVIFLAFILTILVYNRKK